MIIFAQRFEGGEKGRHVGIWERNISSKENNRGKKKSHHVGGHPVYYKNSMKVTMAEAKGGRRDE